MENLKAFINKNRNLLFACVVIILLIISLVFGYKAYIEYRDYKNTEILKNELRIDIEEGTEKVSYNDRYQLMKQKNEDFIGWVSFKSGLINQPFVQTNNNDKYLNLDYNLEKNSHGTAFMDMFQKLDSQNITLYGHYVYKDDSLMFSPLSQLVNENNYDSNNLINLFLGNEIRVYEIIAVVDYNVEIEPLYQYGDFTKTELKQFFDLIENHKYYDTNVTYDENDNFLTLQTCVRNKSNNRLLVIAKEIEKKEI